MTTQLFMVALIEVFPDGKGGAYNTVKGLPGEMTLQEAADRMDVLNAAASAEAPECVYVIVPANIPDDLKKRYPTLFT